MSDTSQLNLREPEKTDWDKFNAGSNYQAPPPAVGVDGKPIVYSGQLPKEFTFEGTDDGFLQVLIDPITIVRSGNGADGYTLRFSRASVRPFGYGTPRQKNEHALGLLLRSAGVVAKPQTNDEYIASVKQSAGRVVQFTIDWEARNKETGEVVRGYQAFPDDPERPGQKKAILRAGDEYFVLDQKGQPSEKRTVTSEVLFANGRLKFFRDPNRK